MIKRDKLILQTKTLNDGGMILFVTVIFNLWIKI